MAHPLGATVRDHPVFVPFGREHLAAVVTVPDEEPRGLVVLLTGASTARSHRYQVWTRAAALLAEDGLASVRMDYIGTGDSTGTLPEWRLEVLPTDQALAVVRFAMRATGVDRFAVAGNCAGARVALGLAAAEPSCVGSLCIRAPLLQRSRMSERIVQAKKSPLANLVRRSSLLSRLARPLSRRKRKAGEGIRGVVAGALGHGPVMFLYSDEDFTFTHQVRQQLDRLVGALPVELRLRCELRVRPGRGFLGLQSLPVQEMLIDTVVEWMQERFVEASSAVPQASRPRPV
jgi:pimeloyl-ACP methyl ester carboxylesterase